MSYVIQNFYFSFAIHCSKYPVLHFLLLARGNFAMLDFSLKGYSDFESCGQRSYLAKSDLIR